MRLYGLALVLASGLCGPSAAAAAAATSPVRATSVRYALVVGNNYGRAPPGVDLPALRHAEAEAQALRDKLVRLAGFDASPERTAVLLGKSRDDILQAAQALARIHQRDRAELGDLPTLFAFFFTGHGLSGQLLTAGEPITGSDLAAIFNNVGATFTVGVFDACFSGSLDLASLSSKGLRLTPGFNVFDALPQEVLEAQGTMWFVSSRPDQVSYEDDKIGGVFTHYFMQAMEAAPHAGLGITLEEIWEYARSRTQHHTRSAVRPQTPQKLIRNLTSTGPLYFSFPATRSALLAFAPELAGRFLLRYDDGQLSEAVSKAPGEPLRVAVFPGAMELQRLGGDSDDRQQLQLASGETVWVKDASRFAAHRALGSREEALVPKGGRLQGLVLTREVQRLAPMADAGYVVGLPAEQGGQATHGASIGLGLEYGWAHARLGYTYGYGKHSFEAWGYRTSRHGLELSTGAGYDLRRFRLGAALLGRVTWQSVRYDNGATGRAFVPAAGLAAFAFWSFMREPVPVYLWSRLALMAEHGQPVAPRDAQAGWWLYPELQLGLAVQLQGQ